MIIITIIIDKNIYNSNDSSKVSTKYNSNGYICAWRDVISIHSL